MRNANEQVQIFKFASAMSESGLSAEFVTAAADLAMKYRGAFGLLKLWFEESSKKERNLIVSDIQQEIEDASEAPNTPENIGYVKFNSIPGLAADLLKFKKKLRSEIEDFGGITKLAAITGIAQPYLSRLFSSGIRPRRRTLSKIYLALGKDLPHEAVHHTS